ncbi:MAG: PrgI family protein [Candidatus Gracilibacteria bacterium]|nr:PrgI family protein [Candidatus Gracilibacteria bacterium]
MQYKIPVQIENEDKIFLNLSIRQLVIIMVGGGFGYMVFKSLEPNVGASVALFPTIIIIGLALVIALFRHTEMTFIPFILNLIRLNLNVGNRTWSKGVDSYNSLEVGYIRALEEVKNNGENKNSHQTFESVEEKLGKL